MNKKNDFALVPKSPIAVEKAEPGAKRILAVIVADMLALAPVEEAETLFRKGRAYYSGDGVPKDHAEAVRWFRKAAVHGHTEAHFYLGCMYDKGTGVPKNYVEAAMLYRKAAEHRHADAQYNLGLMYWKGEGVPKDLVEAAKWWRMAAGQGKAVAQYNIGLMHEAGLGVSVDHVEAVKWLRKAAEQRHFNAMPKLGLKYFKGEGVPKNEIEGLAWLKLKTGLGRDTDGHEDSMKIRTWMETSLGHQMVLAAEKRSREILEATRSLESRRLDEEYSKQE